VSFRGAWRVARGANMATVTSLDVRGDLHDYLRGARETLVWKLDGLGEYDIRRPMTPTGTNLLGLVKHQAATHLAYFCAPFGRPHELSLPWVGADPNTVFFAAPDESRDDIVALYRRTWEIADTTITELPLDAEGEVPWWGRVLTLHHALVHVIADAQRHAGHADIIRELIDGSVGLLEGADNLLSSDPAQWSRHRDLVERAARLASGR
jgi:hypothetical protein